MVNLVWIRNYINYQRYKRSRFSFNHFFDFILNSLLNVADVVIKTENPSTYSDSLDGWRSPSAYGLKECFCPHGYISPDAGHYHCQECGVSSRFKVSIIRHEVKEHRVQHDGVQTFSCDRCGDVSFSGHNHKMHATRCLSMGNVEDSLNSCTVLNTFDTSETDHFSNRLDDRVDDSMEFETQDEGLKDHSDGGAPKSPSIFKIQNAVVMTIDRKGKRSKVEVSDCTLEVPERLPDGKMICPVCGKKCVTMQNAKRHMAINHNLLSPGLTLYICSPCSLRSCILDNFNKHCLSLNHKQRLAKHGGITCVRGHSTKSAKNMCVPGVSSEIAVKGKGILKCEKSVHLADASSYEADFNGSHATSSETCCQDGSHIKDKSNAVVITADWSQTPSSESLRSLLTKLNRLMRDRHEHNVAASGDAKKASRVKVRQDGKIALSFVTEFTSLEPGVLPNGRKSCPVCGKDFADSGRIKQHMAFAHNLFSPGITMYHCKVCPLKTCCLKDFVRHCQRRSHLSTFQGKSAKHPTQMNTNDSDAAILPEEGLGKCQKSEKNGTSDADHGVDDLELELLLSDGEVKLLSDIDHDDCDVSSHENCCESNAPNAVELDWGSVVQESSSAPEVVHESYPTEPSESNKNNSATIVVLGADGSMTTLHSEEFSAQKPTRCPEKSVSICPVCSREFKYYITALNHMSTVHNLLFPSTMLYHCAACNMRTCFLRDFHAHCTTLRHKMLSKTAGDNPTIKQPHKQQKIEDTDTVSDNAAVVSGGMEIENAGEELTATRATLVTQSFSESSSEQVIDEVDKNAEHAANAVANQSTLVVRISEDGTKTVLSVNKFTDLVPIKTSNHCYSCPLCKKDFVHYAGAQSHMVTTHDLIFPNIVLHHCMPCGLRTMSEKDFTVHCNTVKHNSMITTSQKGGDAVAVVVPTSTKHRKLAFGKRHSNAANKRKSAKNFSRSSGSGSDHSVDCTATTSDSESDMPKVVRKRPITFRSCKTKRFRCEKQVRLSTNSCMEQNEVPHIMTRSNRKRVLLEQIVNKKKIDSFFNGGICSAKSHVVRWRNGNNPISCWSNEHICMTRCLSGIKNAGDVVFPSVFLHGESKTVDLQRTSNANGKSAEIMANDVSKLVESSQLHHCSSGTGVAEQLASNSTSSEGGSKSSLQIRSSRLAMQVARKRTAPRALKNRTTSSVSQATNIESVLPVSAETCPVAAPMIEMRPDCAGQPLLGNGSAFDAWQPQSASIATNLLWSLLATLQQNRHQNAQKIVPIVDASESKRTQSPHLAGVASNSALEISETNSVQGGPDVVDLVSDDENSKRTTSANECESVLPPLDQFSVDELWMALEGRATISTCVCGAHFFDPALYNLHKVCHSSRQPLQCPFCGYDGANWYDVYSHLLDHGK